MRCNNTTNSTFIHPKKEEICLYWETVSYVEAEFSILTCCIDKICLSSLRQLNCNDIFSRTTFDFKDIFHM